MTHTRNTPASGADEFDDRTAPPGPPSERDLDQRSLRARTEAMDVMGIGSGQYRVHSESGNDYLVDVNDRRCTCPDHAIRGVRCKHLRRVAMEITAGSVAPPSYVASTCASCGDFALVPPGASEPHLCERHRLAVGDRVRDRETGDVIVVVAVSPRRADEVTIPGRNVTVAGYETNAAYPASDPVVAAVYPSVRVTREGARPESLRAYSFPLSRLERVRERDGARR
ncbi:SWIM zinc finger family protein [Halorubellus sp. JP-L1]|uniref:SWIM zinc finger family protein n=1 Tax=Halorubellus sp. JP-L1 TaxID=2715753 RepID=UPI001407F415|nr:SWIM zinc finger family protein [Halorubellus sp. JP-L1]NHN43557.1 SWIM zinc finger family protein [Halorubellus sp. JP-L1]